MNQKDSVSILQNKISAPNSNISQISQIIFGDSAPHLEPDALARWETLKDSESLTKILFVIAISLMQQMYSPEARYLGFLAAQKKAYNLGIDLADFLLVVEAFDNYKKANRSPIEGMF